MRDGVSSSSQAVVGRPALRQTWRRKRSRSPSRARRNDRQEQPGRLAAVDPQAVAADLHGGDPVAALRVHGARP